MTHEKITLNKPTVVLVGGIAGSGKTSLVHGILPLVYDSLAIDKDTLNKSFLLTQDDLSEGINAYKMSGPTIPRSSNHYGRNVKLQSYHAMLALARDNLNLGKHPFLDGNYTKEIRKGYLETVVYPFFRDNVGHSVNVKLVFCHASESEIQDRIRRRATWDRDAEKMASDEAWKKLMEEQPILPPELEKYDHVKINTEENDEDACVKRAIEYLKQ